MYVDCTVGGGGHSFEIAKRLNFNRGGRLICMDQDADALAAASNRLSEFADTVCLCRSNYVNIREVLKERGIESVDGILVDLGVSSYQLDTPERGFSYMADAPLDMRMDVRSSFSAFDVVNNYSEDELSRLIYAYGEEKFSRSIAKRICAVRENSPIKTTGELSEIICSAIPAKIKRGAGHPAKRTFQAIRIEVNHELDVLESSLDTMIDLLSDGGRLAVIAFHSLEDRIVKVNFRKNEHPCVCPPDFPICVCGKVSTGRAVSRKPILPTESEIRDNPRSKSAKLRVFERVR